MVDQEWKKLVEEHITEYLSNINFKKQEFNINVMEEQLRGICGVKPSINVKWDVKNKVNELKKQAGADDYMERIEKPVEIEVVLANENNFPIKLNFYI